MSKNQEKYNRRMNRDSYFPPLHGTSSYNHMDALQAYFDAMPEDWQKTEFSKSIQPSISKKRVNLDVGDFSKGEPLEEIEEESVFDKIFNKDTLQAAVGNVAGNAVNAGFNALLQENQLDNQKELQNRAAQLNAEAVRMQPQLQVEGMRNAGLNPAQVNGTGAPSLQAGAAAGANSTIGNIFMGIADMIAASKAPSEIEKILAEKELLETEVPKTEAETKSILEAQIPNLQASTNKFVEEAQNIKNANDVFKARDEFLRNTSLSIWDNYRANLKASGQWDKYPERTKATINSLADGEIEMGVGELEALNETINSQANLSNRDREIYDNLLKMTITRNQLNDENVVEALYKLPEKLYNKTIAETAELWAMVGKLMVETNREQAQIEYDKIENQIKRMESPAWLSVYGDYKEEKAQFDNANFDMVRDVIRNLIPASLIGKGMGAFKGSKPSPSPLGNKPNGMSNKDWNKMNKNYQKNARKTPPW